MKRQRLVATTFATTLAIASVSAAVALSQVSYPPVAFAPTPPPSPACPPIRIPPLGPTDPGVLATAAPVAPNLPQPSVMAAPTVGPEPCPTPVPGPVGGDALGPLPGLLSSPPPIIMPAGPMPTPMR
jgi:hypothetical protein